MKKSVDNDKQLFRELLNRLSESDIRLLAGIMNILVQDYKNNQKQAAIYDIEERRAIQQRRDIMWTWWDCSIEFPNDKAKQNKIVQSGKRGERR